MSTEKNFAIIEKLPVSRINKDRVRETIRVEGKTYCQIDVKELNPKTRYTKRNLCNPETDEHITLYS